MGVILAIFISSLVLTQSRVSSADLVGDASDGAKTDAGNGTERGVRNVARSGPETDVPSSVLRPSSTAAASMPIPVPCSEKPFEFLDLTTGTCASCILICGAKRSEYCLKEPNCQGSSRSNHQKGGRGGAGVGGTCRGMSCLCQLRSGFTLDENHLTV